MSFKLIKIFFISCKTNGVYETFVKTFNFLRIRLKNIFKIYDLKTQKKIDETYDASITNINICNICGHNKFGAGPGGRMAISGKAPRCLQCQALERHRIFRDVFNKLRGSNNFKDYDCLQFSSDSSTDASWFKSFTCSVYGKENSLDLQKIDKPSCAYDLVVCNHVLEHVPYDNSALNELGRVIKSDGFVFLSFPEPLSRKKTSDWGFPKAEQHGHYRLYGMDDVLLLFKKFIPHLYILSIFEIDKVTSTKDIIFFLCKSKHGIKKISKVFTNLKLVQKP